jgi:hypothetical protein
LGDWEIDGFRLNDKYEDKKSQLELCEITETYFTFKGKKIGSGGNRVYCDEGDTTLSLSLEFEYDGRLSSAHKKIKFKVEPNYQAIFQQLIKKFGEPDLKAKEEALYPTKVDRYGISRGLTFVEMACWGHECRYEPFEYESDRRTIYSASGGKIARITKGKTLQSSYSDFKEGEYTHAIDIFFRDYDTSNSSIEYGDKLRREHQSKMKKDKIDF